MSYILTFVYDEINEFITLKLHYKLTVRKVRDKKIAYPFDISKDMIIVLHFSALINNLDIC